MANCFLYARQHADGPQHPDQPVEEAGDPGLGEWHRPGHQELHREYTPYTVLYMYYFTINLYREYILSEEIKQFWCDCIQVPILKYKSTSRLS